MKADIRTTRGVKEAFNRGVDIILHLAASTDVNRAFSNALYDFDVNVRGTLNVLSLAARANVRRFVLLSSMRVFGRQQQLPIPEQAAKRPIDYHGQTKAMAESLVLFFERTGRVPCWILRPTSVYGPYQESHGVSGVVSIFINRIIDGSLITVYGGHQVRDFVYIGWLASWLSHQSDLVPCLRGGP